VDVTNFQSGPDQEFINTIRNNGSLKITGNRVSNDAGQIAVEAAFASGAVTPFTLALPKTAAQVTTADTYTFSALVESREFDLEVSKEIGFTVSLKISGPVTFTVGA
jgi:hypothetical protein